MKNRISVILTIITLIAAFTACAPNSDVSGQNSEQESARSELDVFG